MHVYFLVSSEVALFTLMHGCLFIIAGIKKHFKGFSKVNTKSPVLKKCEFSAETKKAKVSGLFQEMILSV